MTATLQLPPLERAKGKGESLPAHHAEQNRVKVVQCREYGEVQVPLEDLMIDGKLDLYPEIEGKGYLRVSIRKSHLAFQAGGFVGLIPVNERVTLDVRPKVPTRSLERLLGVTDHVPRVLGRRAHPFGTVKERTPFLLDVLARSLIEALREVRAQGVHKAYKCRSEDTSFPKGRIEIGETMRRHLARGVAHRAHALWFEQSSDTPVNRCVKYAIWALAQRYRVMPDSVALREILAGLNGVYRLFGGVTLDYSRSFRRDPTVRDASRLTGIRGYYRRALDLARAISDDRGVTFDGRNEEVLLTAFVVNLEVAFETYIRATLANRLADLGSDFSILDGNLGPPKGAKRSLFDLPPSSDAKPDIVIRRRTSGNAVFEVPLLVDAKYKSIMNAPREEDVYQAIAHGYAFRAPHVVIIHPRVEDGPQGLRPLGNIDKLSLHLYGFDLAATDLDAEESAFASEMKKLIVRTGSQQDV